MDITQIKLSLDSMFPWTFWSTLYFFLLDTQRCSFWEFPLPRSVSLSCGKDHPSFSGAYSSLRNLLRAEDEKAGWWLAHSSCQRRCVKESKDRSFSLAVPSESTHSLEREPSQRQAHSGQGTQCACACTHTSMCHLPMVNILYTIQIKSTVGHAAALSHFSVLLWFVYFSQCH